MYRLILCRDHCGLPFVLQACQHRHYFASINCLELCIIPWPKETCLQVLRGCSLPYHGGCKCRSTCRGLRTDISHRSCDTNSRYSTILAVGYLAQSCMALPPWSKTELFVRHVLQKQPPHLKDPEISSFVSWATCRPQPLCLRLNSQSSACSLEHKCPQHSSCWEDWDSRLRSQGSTTWQQKAALHRVCTMYSWLIATFPCSCAIHGWQWWWAPCFGRFSLVLASLVCTVKLCCENALLSRLYTEPDGAHNGLLCCNGVKAGWIMQINQFSASNLIVPYNGNILAYLGIPASWSKWNFLGYTVVSSSSESPRNACLEKVNLAVSVQTSCSPPLTNPMVTGRNDDHSSVLGLHYIAWLVNPIHHITSVLVSSTLAFLQGCWVVFFCMAWPAFHFVRHQRRWLVIAATLDLVFQHCQYIFACCCSVRLRVQFRKIAQQQYFMCCYKGVFV